MLIIGLTGSIGMGKTTTAELFAKEGARVFNADDAVHQLYETTAVAPIMARFPAAIVDNRVERTILAREITGNPAALKDLEEIIHPLVAQARNDFIENSKADKIKIVVLDIPLLFENNIHKICDKTVVVTATKEIQRERVLARPGMTEEKFEILLSRQMNDSDKQKLADFIIRTDKGIEHAHQQVRDILSVVKIDAGKQHNA